MNTTTQTNDHRFNLAGMKPGDWFIGCPNCWEQLPTNGAGPLRCAKCSTTSRVYNVTEFDRKRIADDNKKLTHHG